MPEGSACERCGTALLENAGRGLCPRCLIGAGLGLLRPEPLSDAGTGNRLGSLRSFGDYEILEEIARGGMGVVYRARQRSLDRIVALKFILSGELASEAVILRFQNEAQSAASLHHPNIVTIHEVGEELGLHYFSMDYIEGGSLSDLIRQGPLDARRAAELVEKIARTLHYAHLQGVLHRDLKPSNVLIDVHGDPHLTDFGLSKRLPNATSQSPYSELTLSGQVVGSPGFLSPEQATGNIAALKPTSDLYALGAILYFLLTGRPPFQAAGLAETLRAVLEDAPISPRTLDRSIPVDVETLCLKCLDKEPSKRYPSAEAFADELRRFLHHEPIQARPVSAVEKGWRWCQRKPALAGVVILALIVAVGSPVAVIRFNQERLTARREARQARKNLYAADMNQALQALRADDTAYATALINKYVPAGSDTSEAAALRGWEWGYIWDQTRSDEIATLGSHSYSVISMGLSPDGRTLASPSVAGDLKLWDLSSRSLVRTLTNGWRFNGAAFSPDGRWLAAGGEYGISVLWDVRTWQKSRELQQAMWVHTPLFSPDSQYLVVGAGQGHTVWELSSGKMVSRLASSRDVNWPAGVAFSPEGLTLAYSEGDPGTVVIWDLKTTSRQHVLSGHTASVSGIAFSPDGKRLVTAGADKVLKVWDTRSWVEVAALKHFANRLFTAAFSPDGKTVAVGSGDQRIHLIDTEDWIERGVLKGHLGSVFSTLFLPDGRTLVSSGQDGQIKLWDTRRIPPKKTVFELPKDVDPNFRTMGLSSDGRLCLAVRTNGTFSIWDTYSFEEIERGPVPVTNAQSASLSHNGERSVFLGEGGRVVVVDRTGKRPMQTFENGFDDVFRLAFSPDGSLLACASSNHTIKTWDLSTGQERDTLRIPDGPGLEPYVTALEFSQNSRELFSGHFQGRARIWDLASGRELALFNGHKEQARSVGQTVDGTTFFTVSRDCTIGLWSRQSVKPKSVLHAGPYHFRAHALSPDESRLAAGTSNGTVELWDLTSDPPVHVASLAGHESSVTSIAFSRDGNTLVSLSDNSLRTWHSAPHAHQPR